jgi:hypothetical protein
MGRSRKVTIETGLLFLLVQRRPVSRIVLKRMWADALAGFAERSTL